MSRWRLRLPSFLLLPTCLLGSLLGRAFPSFFYPWLCSAQTNFHVQFSIFVY